LSSFNLFKSTALATTDKMGWRDLLIEEEPKKLPEMTTIYDAQTQSIQLILWSDYIGKGYQAYDWSQRARRRRSQAFKRTVAENEMLPEDVEGCDIASPFRDFMAESLRETNEKVKIEMAKTMKALLDEMDTIKKLQASTEKENELLKLKLAESEKYIDSLKEDMGQVQKATWENRNFRIEMKQKIEKVETHLEKTVGFDAKSAGKGPNKKSAPIPDYTTVYNPRTKQADLQLLGEYLSTPGNPRPKQDWAMVYDEVTKSAKLIFWNDYVKLHEPAFVKMRREKQIQELERKFDKDMEYAPLSIRSKVAMIKFWLKTIDLPEEDNFREAFERARNLYSEGNKVGVEVPKAIFETLSECDLDAIWEHQTPQVLFEGNFSFLKELKKRLQSEDKNFPKLPIRDYKNPKKVEEPKVELEPKVEKGQLDQKVGEKQARKVSSGASRNLWAGTSAYSASEASGQDLDPFTSMFLIS